MRTLEYTNQFKRDFKREKKGQHRNTLEGDLNPMVKAFDELLVIQTHLNRIKVSYLYKQP